MTTDTHAMETETESRSRIRFEDLSASEAGDIQRLMRLKAERDSLDQEIKYLTTWARKTIARDCTPDENATVQWDGEDGRTYAVTVSKATALPSVDIEALAGINPELLNEITKTEIVVVRDRLDDARRFGFFAKGRPEAAAYSEARGTRRVTFTAIDRKEAGNG